MTRVGNVLVLAVGVVALSVTGCSSDDAAAPATSVVDPTVVATDPPATSTSVTTTEAPTTTIDPAATLAAEVEADFLEADRLAKEAAQDPFNAEKEQAALDRRLGVLEENFKTTLANFRERNYAIRANPSTPPSIVVEQPAVLVSEGADVAQIQVCEIDSWVVVEVGAGPNNTDAIVDPDVVGYRSTIFLRNIEGIWKIEGGTEIGRWEAVTECPAE